jgi:hypothetical protein
MPRIADVDPKPLIGGIADVDPKPLIGGIAN